MEQDTCVERLLRQAVHDRRRAARREALEDLGALLALRPGSPAWRAAHARYGDWLRRSAAAAAASLVLLPSAAAADTLGPLGDPPSVDAGDPVAGSGDQAPAAPPAPQAPEPAVVSPGARGGDGPDTPVVDAPEPAPETPVVETPAVDTPGDGSAAMPSGGGTDDAGSGEPPGGGADPDPDGPGEPTVPGDEPGRDGGGEDADDDQQGDGDGNEGRGRDEEGRDGNKRDRDGEDRDHDPEPPAPAMPAPVIPPPPTPVPAPRPRGDEAPARRTAPPVAEPAAGDADEPGPALDPEPAAEVPPGVEAPSAAGSQPAATPEEAVAAAAARPVTRERIAAWVASLVAAVDRKAVDPAPGPDGPVVLAEVAATPTLGRSYRVQPGDSLWGIARGLWGDAAGPEDVEATWRVLYAWNAGALAGAPDELAVGVVLELPADTGGMVVASAAAVDASPADPPGVSPGLRAEAPALRPAPAAAAQDPLPVAGDAGDPVDPALGTATR